METNYIGIESCQPDHENYSEAHVWLFRTWCICAQRTWSRIWDFLRCSYPTLSGSDSSKEWPLNMGWKPCTRQLKENWRYQSRRRSRRLAARLKSLQTRRAPSDMCTATANKSLVDIRKKFKQFLSNCFWTLSLGQLRDILFGFNPTVGFDLLIFFVGISENADFPLLTFELLTKMPPIQLV